MRLTEKSGDIAVILLILASSSRPNGPSSWLTVSSSSLHSLAFALTASSEQVWLCLA